jgi:tetratricopeptide (TPR) repeat protein
MTQPPPLIDNVTLTSEAGLPTFTFITSSPQFPRLYQLFPMGILTVDVPTLRQLPLPPFVQMPEDASLRIEFSLDDISSGELIWDIHLPAALRWELARVNQQSRTIQIILKNATGTVLALDVIKPYILDWSGMVGLVMYIRNALTQGGRQWDKTNAYDILRGMQETVSKYGGYVTDLHSQMGLIYRTFGEFDKAHDCYVAEIKGAKKTDGSFTSSAMRAFSNLGVLYKKQLQIDKAIAAFRVALSMNPNYFEAHYSVAGCLEDTKLMIEHLACAFRLQPNHPLWNQIIYNMATGHGQPPQHLFDQIQIAAQDVDLDKKLAFDTKAFHSLKLGI